MKTIWRGRRPDVYAMQDGAVVLQVRLVIRGVSTPGTSGFRRAVVPTESENKYC